MASLHFYDILLLFIVFLISIATVLYRRRHFPVTNWPFVGMAPDFLLNLHHIHDFATLLLKVSDGTFKFKGPWFANMDMLFTCDPENIHHMLSKKFSNYPRGPEFRKIFDVLGDGIFNSDHELWEMHRKTTMSLLKHPSFPTLLERNIKNKVENGLLPILAFVSSHNQEIDLQEIFQRFTFDTICLLLLNHDPESLSLDLPYIPCERALTGAEEALLWRHFLPEKVWKLQKRFGLGKEKQLGEAVKTVNEFIYKCLSRKQVEEESGLLMSLKRHYEGQRCTSGDKRKFLKDAVLNLLVAGRDTTSTGLAWFFYLLTQNPNVEKKIREEITNILGGRNWKNLGVKELGGLVYLHGGICEALRLYPPVALNHKSPTLADIFPSGHVVGKHTRILLSYYSMGRMEAIWGEDCMAFKPERWFSQGGRGIKHEPSYKFVAFNSGPRICLGKEMSLIQMKMVVTAIISHYHVELVKGHHVCPSDSVILQMKNGLKVRLFPINQS